MPADSFVLGVDGGATKTVALVARPDGSIVGVGRAGCGCIYATASPDTALNEVMAAVEAATGMAGVPRECLAAGAFSMAGGDWPEDLALIEAAMLARQCGRRVIAVNDAMGALRAASPDGLGVIVVCGTATATGARAPNGRTWHSGFWQDAGGSHALAEQCLRAVYRAELGLETATSLTARVLRLLGEETVEAVLHRYTARRRLSLPETGEVTRLLLDEAAAGDAVAARIVSELGVGLAQIGLVAARRVGFGSEPFPLYLAGGVFRHPSGVLANVISARLREEAPGIQVSFSPLEPAMGAVMLALEAAGTTVDAPLYAELRQRMPGAPLFAS